MKAMKFLILILISGLPSVAVWAQSQEIYGSITVAHDDTLYSISRRTCVSLKSITETNGISGYTISTGQVLKIPLTLGNCFKGTSQSNAVLSSSESLAIVKPDGRNIPKGKIQSSGLAPVSQSQTPNTILVHQNEYMVLPLDTFYSISRRSCSSVKELSRINNISRPQSALKPGLSLYLPVENCFFNGAPVGVYKPVKAPQTFTLEEQNIIIEEKRKAREKELKERQAAERSRRKREQKQAEEDRQNRRVILGAIIGSVADGIQQGRDEIAASDERARRRSLSAETRRTEDEIRNKVEWQKYEDEQDAKLRREARQKKAQEERISSRKSRARMSSNNSDNKALKDTAKTVFAVSFAPPTKDGTAVCELDKHFHAYESASVVSQTWVWHVSGIAQDALNNNPEIVGAGLRADGARLVCSSKYTIKNWTSLDKYKDGINSSPTGFERAYIGLSSEEAYLAFKDAKTNPGARIFSSLNSACTIVESRRWEFCDSQ